MLGYWFANEPTPEVMADLPTKPFVEKIFKAIDKPAWDTTWVVQWTSNERYNYLWDRKRKMVQVRWGDNKVQFYTTSQSGVAWNKDKILAENEQAPMVQKAYKQWRNDSFWLNLPAKIQDDGILLQMAEYKKQNVLLVTHTVGGLSPGDIYCWQIDSNSGLPLSASFWIKSIPMGGTNFAWENWTQLDTGANIATKMYSSYKTINISELAGETSWEKLHYTSDPFSPLINASAEN